MKLSMTSNQHDLIVSEFNQLVETLAMQEAIDQREVHLAIMHQLSQCGVLHQVPATEFDRIEYVDSQEQETLEEALVDIERTGESG